MPYKLALKRSFELYRMLNGLFAIKESRARVAVSGGCGTRPIKTKSIALFAKRILAPFFCFFLATF